MKTIICLFTTTVVMADAPGKKREGGSKRKGNFDGVNRKRAAIAAAHTAATTTADIAAAASTAAADTAAADANASTIRDLKERLQAAEAAHAATTAALRESNRATAVLRNQNTALQREVDHFAEEHVTPPSRTFSRPFDTDRA
jgi:hypothetical protein